MTKIITADMSKPGLYQGTLATLDLRGNALHAGIVGRLRRTMEEKRAWRKLWDSTSCLRRCIDMEWRTETVLLRSSQLYFGDQWPQIKFNSQGWLYMLVPLWPSVVFSVTSEMLVTGLKRLLSNFGQLGVRSEKSENRQI